MASLHLADSNAAPAPFPHASIVHEKALPVKNPNGVELLLRRGNGERWLDEHSPFRTEQLQALVS
jgi:hypothetical protein